MHKAGLVLLIGLLSGSFAVFADEAPVVDINQDVANAQVD